MLHFLLVHIDQVSRDLDERRCEDGQCEREKDGVGLVSPRSEVREEGRAVQARRKRIDLDISGSYI